MMPSRLRLHSAKRVGRAPAFVLRVSAKSLAWLQGPGRAEVSMQYHGFLIDTDHRFPLRQNADRFSTHPPSQFAFYRFLGDEPHTPSCLSLGRRTADHSDDPLALPR